MEGYLNTTETARLTGFSRWKIRRYSKAGKFPMGHQLLDGGRGTYYREDEVREWLRRGEKEARGRR